MCCCTSEDDYSCRYNITFAKWKVADRGLEGLYITLKSLKYNIRIASQNLINLTTVLCNAKFWLDAYALRNASPTILITPQSEKHEKWCKSFNGIFSPICTIQSNNVIIKKETILNTLPRHTKNTQIDEETEEQPKLSIGAEVILDNNSTVHKKKQANDRQTDRQTDRLLYLNSYSTNNNR